MRTLCARHRCRDGRARAHGRARPRGVGAVRALRVAHARRDRRRSRARVDRRRNTSFRFRRSCSTCADRPIFAPAASCRSAGSRARHVFVRDESRTLVGVGEALGALLAPRKVFVCRYVEPSSRASTKRPLRWRSACFDGCHRPSVFTTDFIAAHREIARRTLGCASPAGVRAC